MWSEWREPQNKGVLSVSFHMAQLRPNTEYAVQVWAAKDRNEDSEIQKLVVLKYTTPMTGASTRARARHRCRRVVQRTRLFHPLHSELYVGQFILQEVTQ